MNTRGRPCTCIVYGSRVGACDYAIVGNIVRGGGTGQHTAVATVHIECTDCRQFERNSGRISNGRGGELGGGTGRAVGADIARITFPRAGVGFGVAGV